MKDNQKSKLLIELTAAEASAINGGKHGADDPPGHDAGDDKGGRR
ncbi:hypothetical protein [Pseudanabaena sp. PCC 6802]|nr:hypothetical protein [Pseudanabaena sp. PCC 6802]